VTIKNKIQKLRFVAIGGINTIIDFGILFSLKALGLPTIPANVLSTTAAFCFSFFANKKFTFQTKNTNVKRELLLFILVTLFGLWVLQSIVIQAVSPLLAGILPSNDGVLLIAKLLATCTSLVWNYTMYSRVVFKQEKK
jgi:putative flippase GtrA